MCYSVIKGLCDLVCVTLPFPHVYLCAMILSCLPISCVFCPCVIILNDLCLSSCVSPVCDYVFSYTCSILCFLLYTLHPVSFCCLLTITSCICVLLCTFNVFQKTMQKLPQTFAIIPVCCPDNFFLIFFSVASH
jgi:hypothetical protein